MIEKVHVEDYSEINNHNSQTYSIGYMQPLSINWVNHACKFYWSKWLSEQEIKRKRENILDPENK